MQSKSFYHLAWPMSNSILDSLAILHLNSWCAPKRTWYIIALIESLHHSDIWWASFCVRKLFSLPSIIGSLIKIQLARLIGFFSPGNIWQHFLLFRVPIMHPPFVRDGIIIMGKWALNKVFLPPFLFLAWYSLYISEDGWPGKKGAMKVFVKRLIVAAAAHIARAEQIEPLSQLQASLQ